LSGAVTGPKKSSENFQNCVRPMNMPLRVLIVEDSEFDTLLLVDALHRSGYEPDFARVETREAMASALASKTWDVVVSDHNLPRFSMFEALQLLEQSGHDLPFIIVSGGIGEDTAVAAMKAGAHDYLMKGDLSRLAPAVARELRQAAVRAARRQAETALRESELRYRLLWEASTDAVIFVDAGGQIHFANPAVETVFGYPPGEVIGQSVTLLQPQGPVGEALPTNWELPPDGVSSRRAAREARGRHKDGHIFPVDIAWSLIDWQGVKWRVAFIRDLTELKKTAQALRENEEQFRVAREIQERLFPKAAPQWPGIDLAGASFPAKATGGDYFDYLSVADGGWGIVVGDVSGHGVGPAMLMAETRAYLRILAQNRGDLGEILARANRALVEDVSDGRFVTLMLAKFESAGRALVYANAGHPPAFVLDASGQV
jgi:PAS domain S-box-containing protein